MLCMTILKMYGLLIVSYCTEKYGEIVTITSTMPLHCDICYISTNVTVIISHAIIRPT